MPQGNYKKMSATQLEAYFLMCLVQPQQKLKKKMDSTKSSNEDVSLTINWGGILNVKWITFTSRLI